MGCFVFLTERHTHLELLNFRSQRSPHDAMLFMSSWMASMSLWVLISRYIFVSSAKIAHFVSGLMHVGRSFMYSKKKSGPSIDPCGTPDVTGNQLDVVPSHLTLCFLFVK